MQPILVLAGLTLVCSGCSSGRVGSVDTLHSGFVVSDRYYNNVKAVTARGIVPLPPGEPLRMNPTGQWVVVQRQVRRLQWLRADPANAEGGRWLLPAWHTEFSAYDIKNNRVVRIPHSLEGQDHWITDACVDRNKLMVVVGSRYPTSPDASEWRHFVYHFDAGQWQGYYADEWERKQRLMTSRRALPAPLSNAVDLGDGIVLKHIETWHGTMALLSGFGDKSLVLYQQNDMRCADVLEFFESMGRTTHNGQRVASR